QKFEGGFVQLNNRGEFTFSAESNPSTIYQGDSLLQSVDIQERVAVTGGFGGFLPFQTSNVSATFATPIKIESTGAEVDVTPYVNVNLSVDNSKLVAIGVVAAVKAGVASLPPIVMAVLEGLKQLGPGALQPLW
ncbi:MAG: hypothetical protein P8129_20185, partial [Anaerolineae bacterium]